MNKYILKSFLSFKNAEIFTFFLIKSFYLDLNYNVSVKFKN